jgi:branched-chain amino acid transport system permease protein
VRPLRTKLLAFAISSFYCGIAGAELVFLYLGSAETLAFDINVSFLVLFMVIIGGLGSVLGSFLGAGFIVLVPIFLTNAPHLVGINLPVALMKQFELMIFGGLILFFLIVEPNGLARLWQISKEKLRLWPFPH